MRLLSQSRWTSEESWRGKQYASCRAVACSATQIADSSVVGTRIGRPPTVCPISKSLSMDCCGASLSTFRTNRPRQYRELKAGSQ